MEIFFRTPRHGDEQQKAHGQRTGVDAPGMECGQENDTHKGKRGERAHRARSMAAQGCKSYSDKRGVIGRIRQETRIQVREHADGQKKL